MGITVSQEQGRAALSVIHIAGHLDGQTYQSLIAKASEIIGTGAKDILLDLSDLTYISSAGLVALHTIALMTRGETPPDPEYGWAQSLKPGDSFEAQGLVSTSLNPEIAKSFASHGSTIGKPGGVVMEIKAKRGVAVGSASEHSEYEVVQAHGTKYKVLGTRAGTEGETVLMLEEV